MEKISAQSYWFSHSQSVLWVTWINAPGGKMCHYTDIKWTATGFSNFPDCSVQLQRRYWQIFSVSILLPTPQAEPLYYFLQGTWQWADGQELIEEHAVFFYPGIKFAFYLWYNGNMFSFVLLPDFSSYIDYKTENSENSVMKWSESLHTC